MDYQPLVELVGVSRRYSLGEVEVEALKPVDLKIYRGELLAILGPSGSGKSTLLNLIGGMDVPTGGKVLFDGQDITEFDEKRLTLFRRHQVGFVFQFFNLIPNLTARENVELAAEIKGEKVDGLALLEKVGLRDRADHFPSQLSGGEQQRVAIARALAKDPEILLCDEPTGALDYQTGIQVLSLLQDINREMGKTVVIVTHNVVIGNMAHRILRMRDGKIDSIAVNEHPVEACRLRW
ncbi:ABC transporter ATP-binding protein [Calderihabitans maritimus]|uniref:ABC transporter-like protein n=1 Tax=Calderihabitans maritimus TaxID=1246530 RepID=A0A1Z5HR96_9FIRM|nr:ABC transporter ATP-binding protein [Calderihabitans maritimus]GAW92046.1 ABC transporter-like protein [Calderihabitans maritimus]